MLVRDRRGDCRGSSAAETGLSSGGGGGGGNSNRGGGEQDPGAGEDAVRYNMLYCGWNVLQKVGVT